MTRALRAAMVACGGVSNLTMRAARRSPDFEVAAIQDPDPAAIERVGERYGVQRRHRTIEEVLQRGDLTSCLPVAEVFRRAVQSCNRVRLPSALGFLRPVDHYRANPEYVPLLARK